MTKGSAIRRVLEAGSLCETYNVGGWNNIRYKYSSYLRLFRGG